jgi:lipopolysaccharide export system protein LptC
MKSWSGQLFPIILLGLLAGLSFWLQTAVDREDPPQEAKTPHQLDASAENFSILRLDENGRLKYRLIAPYMEHFPDDNASLITYPTIVNYRPEAEPVVLSSQHAKISGEGDVIYLWDGVIAHRGKTEKSSAMVASMPDLTIQTEEGFAFTHSPVEISQGNSWMKGTGLHIDNNTSTLVLQSQVSGYYFRSKATP